MTVSSETAKSGPYTGNGVTTVFAYGFRILDAGHIEVIRTVNGTASTVSPGEYTVSGVGDLAGGNVTFSVAPTAAQTITIIRSAPFTQQVDLENQGAYYAETVEQAFDLAAMRDQQMAEELTRAVKLPVGADPSELAALTEDLIRLSDSADEIDAVAGIVADVTTVAGLTAEITALPGQLSEAQTAAATAVAALDSFDDRYLGAKAVAPTVDNDGNALLVGAVYWDTVSNQMFTWSGAEWRPTFLTGNAVRALVTATGGQTVVTVPTYLVGANTIQVYLNGLKVMVGADYTETDQNTITFLSALTAGDEVEVLVLQPYAIGTTGAESITTEYGITLARLLELREGTVADLLADTTLNPAVVPVGSVIEAGGFRYEVAATGASNHHVTTAGGLKLYVLPGEKGLSAYAFGMPTGGDDQALLDKMWYSTADRLHMPPGLYHGYINNNRSGRTIHWDEGAILDGTAHIAVGTGPDTHAVGSITWVDNTRVIGTVTSTVRVGTFYCRGFKADKFRITKIDAAYTNQTAEGGSNGVHLYVGTKDCEIDEILIESATDGVYALGIDRGPTNDADHKPENVYIGRVVVHDNTQAVLSTNDTVKLRIDEIIADSWDTYNAFGLTADTDLHIGRIRAVGSPSTPSRDGIYVLNGVSAFFGDVEIAGSTQIGFRTFNCGRVDADRIRAYNNDLDQVRIESPGSIGEIVVGTGGTGSGVLIQGNANRLSVGRVVSDGGGMVQVTSDDVSIPEIVTRNNKLVGLGYGLWLNGCDRFVNRLVLSDNNSQGFRMNTIVDTTMGAMIIQNNTFGIVGSGVTGFAFDSVVYGGNVTYDTNITLETIAGFRGKRTRQSVSGDRGDASVTLVVGTDAVTQRFGTPLTANRTVTLSTTGAQTGDRFRIVRSALATGASTLGVASLAGIGTKTLAAGQWLDAEFQGSWHLTGFGSL